MNKRARFEKVNDYLEQFADHATHSFTDARQQAVLDLQHYGFPTIKTENWKYTSVNNLLKKVYLPASDKNISKEITNKLLLTNTNQFVFINGYYHAELSNYCENELVFLPICEAYQQHKSLLQKYFATALPIQQTGFTALNTLLFKQGYFLHINAALTKPLHILHISTQLEEQAIHSRNLILLEKGVNTDVVEHYITLDESNNYWRNNVSEIFLAENSRLNYYKIQREAEQAKHIDFITVKQERDAIFNSFNLDLGGKLVRNDLQTTLQATGASCEFSGLYLTRHQQHIDNHTTIEHKQPYTYSREYYKGILADNSRAVFNGRVLVQQDAQKIRSAQKNANLLLSNDAEIDTKPELEIYADDVICTHGATVGQLSDKAIFYLQARGLDENLAKKLLTYGFAYEMVEEIQNEKIRDFVTQQLSIWFSNDQWLQELVQWR